MVIVIGILGFIIIGLLTYLFMLKNELKKLPQKIEELKRIDTNYLIHSEHNLKEINPIITQINRLIKETKTIESDYNNKSKTLMKMITNISHDLRTPLTSAMGYINMILYSKLSEEEKTNELEIVAERLKRLEELINSFFEFSKIISSNKTPEIRKINLNAVLENCIANYYEDYKNTNREISLSYNQNKIIVYSNQELLTRIFENLIGNAYKHSEGNLEIRILKEDIIKITFTNELQYSELDTDKMFDEFYTVDISRTKENTGLGLAIAKEFTEQLNGKIYANKINSTLVITIEF